MAVAKENKLVRGSDLYYVGQRIKENFAAKEDGKGLSTNDYTTDEKTKLAGIESGAQKNVKPDWNAASGDAQILNKPSIPTKTSDLTNDSGFVTSDDIPEGVQPATANPKMDGTAAVGSSAKYAKEDHVHPSDSSKADKATTLAGYGITNAYTKAEVDTAISNKQDTISDIASIRSGAAAGATAVQPAALNAKQDTISDLSAIRSGSALGSTSVQPVDIENMVEAEPIGSIIPPVNPSEFATKEELSQLGQKVDGSPSVEIDLSDYPLVNGFIDGANSLFRTNGNYGNYHRCKFIPAGAFKGRRISVSHKPAQVSATVDMAVLQSEPDASVSSSPLVWADGFSGLISINQQNSPYEFTLPDNANYLGFYITDTRETWDKTPKSVIVLAQSGMFYAKSEVDDLLDEKVNKITGKGLSTNDFTNEDKAKLDSLTPQAEKKYGVKWSLSDFDDLGTRTHEAVGKTATIGIGNTDGSSDFDNIYPWSEMKRCNIKTNANGAKIVTFEGETGFALDGSNGDVFVRIPKFKTNHYIENGYEFVVIGDGYTHPAFIEDGAELDEIFIGAFEASMVSNALHSKSGVIPANNFTGAEFLTAAKARGEQYTLADMRSVDAIWRLMVVEYGCRNSNRVLGYGYSDYFQAAAYQTWSFITQAGTGVNTVVCGTVASEYDSARKKTAFAPGNTICICDSTNVRNIIAERIITSIVAENGQNLSITFDGDPIDVTTDMIIGNAPAICNYCETIGNAYRLSWHTGRANKTPISGSGLDVETINPCRYRWIENPVGNVWQILPDATFNNLQMYVCKNMKDYEMFRITSPYVAIGPTLPEQESNGNKSDVNTVGNPNYWITGLLIDCFARGNNFGKSFDTIHDGTLTSKKGYGGYYYLNTGGPWCIVNGGGFDHLWRSNMLTNRAWVHSAEKWYLYGARLMFKNI